MAGGNGEHANGEEVYGDCAYGEETLLEISFLFGDGIEPYFFSISYFFSFFGVNCINGYTIVDCETCTIDFLLCRGESSSSFPRDFRLVLPKNGMLENSSMFALYFRLGDSEM
jgi:hypothetical protein